MADDMKHCSSNDPGDSGRFKEHEVGDIFVVCTKTPVNRFYVDADFKERMIRWRQDEDDAYARTGEVVKDMG